MKKVATFFIVLCLCISSVFAYTKDSSMESTELVNAILGDGVKATEVFTRGDVSYVSGMPSKLPLRDGVMLSTAGPVGPVDPNKPYTGSSGYVYTKDDNDDYSNLILKLISESNAHYNDGHISVAYYEDNTKTSTELVNAILGEHI